VFGKGVIVVTVKGATDVPTSFIMSLFFCCLSSSFI